MKVISKKSSTYSSLIALCGNPNSGKTTIFNALTGLNQQVANYPGVTVEKVTGQFSVSKESSKKFNLIDIPGAYSLSAFTPDEYIAASVLFGELKGIPAPDVIITVIDATNLERGLYLLFQILQIGCPVVIALNMMDLAANNGLKINCDKLTQLLGGIPVVPVVGNRGKGIEKLKKVTARVIAQESPNYEQSYDIVTENILQELATHSGNSYRTRAQYLRIIFDENGPAEKKFVAQEGQTAFEFVRKGREQIREKFGSLALAETKVLTDRASEIFKSVVRTDKSDFLTLSEKLDWYLLHPVLGPVFLVFMMLLVFQSIFTWSVPFMNIIDAAFSWLAGIVASSLYEGPLRSLLTDGIIGGVGSVLVFIPQIAILFIFIAILEDSGYMPRAAFLVDRMFRWCGLSGKSFIPLLSSFACAVPGIMATRTIDNKKLRLITIMVAPLMTCSARLPVYSIMIAAFIPYKTYFGVLNLPGLVLTLLYLLGIIIAVLVSYVLKKILHKTEQSTFMMEMPSYKLPTFRSLVVRVSNRVKSFVLRAGTVILAITIIIWALSYYPRSVQVKEEYNQKYTILTNNYEQMKTDIGNKIDAILINQPDENKLLVQKISNSFKKVNDTLELGNIYHQLLKQYTLEAGLLSLYYEQHQLRIIHESAVRKLSNNKAGEQIRNSYLGIVGKQVEPLFKPLGWDWKITMSVLASFPAREVIIATLGTIYNLGTDVGLESSSLIDKMRQAKWGDGSWKGKSVFSPAVALSIMVFFALCCQCGATLITIRQETSSWFYPIVTFSYMTIFAYFGALLVYQLFSRFGL